jgi:hypothetical protein
MALFDMSTEMSSSGLWDHTKAGGYGDDTTYKLGAEFLKGLDVEDWGCGPGRFRQFHAGLYWGVDGSPSPAASVVQDLYQRLTQVPAIFMRHVLEHNRCWRRITLNAMCSFERRMVIVVFTPFSTTVDQVLTEVPTHKKLKIPDISLCKTDFLKALVQDSVTCREEFVATGTRYGGESIFFLERSKGA